MSDSRRHISEFSDFEPEVDDAAIARSWEKLKYLLPPEKKRRKGILFFISTGTGRVLTILGILGLSLGAVLYLREIPREEKAVGQTVPMPEKTRVMDRVESQPEKTEAQEQRKEPAQTEIHQQKESKSLATISNATPRGSGKFPDRHIPPGSIKIKEQQDDETHQQPGSINAAVPVAGPDLPARSPGLMESASAPAHARDSSMADVPDLASVTDTFLYLPPVAGELFYGRPEDPVYLSLQPLPAGQSKFSRWIIDLAGGLNQSRTQIGEADQTGAEYKKISFSGSLGLAYRIGKWSVTGHFGFNGNTFEHSDEQVAGYKVIQKKVFSFTSPSAIDTSVTYLVAHTSTSSRARTFYNAGLGLAYRVSRERQSQLEAFVMLDLKSSAYQVSSRNYFGKDTLKYLQTQASGPLQKQVTSLNEDQDQTYKLLSWGMTPGIAYSYFLRNRISLIVRPSYFIQLSRNTITQGLKDFRISQNNLYLEAGIRFRL